MAKILTYYNESRDKDIHVVLWESRVQTVLGEGVTAVDFTGKEDSRPKF